MTNISKKSATVILSGILIGVAFTSISIQPAFAPPMPIAACGPILVPGSYVVTAPLASVDADCITVAVSPVRIDLAGFTITCTSAAPFVDAFGNSFGCQIFNPVEFVILDDCAGPTGIRIGPGVSFTVKGPGSILDYDTGICVTGSSGLIKDVTVDGPDCALPVVGPPFFPFNCGRPDSEGIFVLGFSGVNLSRNVVSDQAQGIVLKGVECPPDIVDDAGVVIETFSCVLNGNVVKRSASLPVPCHGIWLHDTIGYTLTKNTVTDTGEIGAENFDIYVTGASTGNTITNNVAGPSPFGGGIMTSTAFSVGPIPTGNFIVNNIAGTAAGDHLDPAAFAPYADLSDTTPAGSNTWDDNNTCVTSFGAVPASVCPTPP